MITVGAGFDRRDDKRAAGPTELGRGDTGLNAEFIDGIGGRKNTIVLTSASLLSMPSRMKLSFCGRRPFTASAAPPDCPNRKGFGVVVCAGGCSPSGCHG